MIETQHGTGFACCVGETEELMEQTELQITGMMCEACVGHVTKALESVAGVTKADVTLEAGRAKVYHDGATRQALQEAVAEEGYAAS